MPGIRTAFLWAVKALLDDSCLEVVAWGPKGPVVIDRVTLELLRQSRADAPGT
jgi:hypothetical protein